MTSSMTPTDPQNSNNTSKVTCDNEVDSLGLFRDEDAVPCRETELLLIHVDL